MLSGVEQRDDGGWRFRLGSTPEDLPATLYLAFFSYLQTLSLLLDAFELTGLDWIVNEIGVPGFDAFNKGSAM